MITVNNTGYSSTESSRKLPRVFLQIILKFNSDREDFLDEICIFVKPGAFLDSQNRINSCEKNEILDHM